MEKVTKRIGESWVMGHDYLDFSTAFDKVPPGRLVRKITSHRIQGELVNII